MRRIAEFLRTMEVAEAKKIPTVVLQQVKVSERNKTLETFDASMEAFRLAPTIGEVASALNTLRAVESHAPAFSGPQVSSSGQFAGLQAEVQLASRAWCGRA